MTTHKPCCPHCTPALPTPDQLRLRTPGRRLYAALQSGDMTAAELHKAAWDGEIKPETVFMMLSRLERRLAAFGFAIARIGTAGENRLYRLVAL